MCQKLMDTIVTYNKIAHILNKVITSSAEKKPLEFEN